MTRTARSVAKARTGIAGLDELTEGGIPLGRTTLVHGGTGTGKTIFAMQCLVHGASVEGEPGVFVSFGESVTEARENGASLGLELAELEAAGKLIVDSALDTIDHLFATAASAGGALVTAVVLSGLGTDGAAGTLVVKEKGGTVLVEDPLTAEWPDMPAATIRAGAVDMILASHDIGPALTHSALAR